MPAPATQPGPGAVELGAAQRDGPLAVAAGVDPADRARVAAAVEALERADGVERGGARRAADRGRRVQQPGELERARAPASRSRPRIGVARWATWPEHRDLGDRRRRRARRSTAVERVDDRVDDEAVLAVCPSPTRPSASERLVAVGDGGARDGRDSTIVADAAHEQLGARADEARRPRRRSSPAAGARAARTMSRQVERRVGLDDAPRARARPSRARRRRSRRARARTASSPLARAIAAPRR